eukprot:6818984-Prymnesium_polylepis.2
MGAGSMRSGFHADRVLVLWERVLLGLGCGFHGIGVPSGPIGLGAAYDRVGPPLDDVARYHVVRVRVVHLPLIGVGHVGVACWSHGGHMGVKWWSRST